MLTDTEPEVFFDPQEVLVPTDFDLMRATEVHPDRRAMDLAVALLFFPDRRERMEEIGLVRESYRTPEGYDQICSTIETAFLAGGLMQDHLSLDVLHKWAEEHWEELVSRQGIPRYSTMDWVKDIEGLIGAKMLLPERHEEIKQLLQKHDARSRYFITQVNKPGELMRWFRSIATVLLARPELRPKLKISAGFFETVKPRLDFTRTHQASSLDRAEVDSFPDVMFALAILGDPNARIDESGRLVLGAKKAPGQQPPLPGRLTV